VKRYVADMLKPKAIMTVEVLGFCFKPQNEGTEAERRWQYHSERYAGGLLGEPHGKTWATAMSCQAKRTVATTGAEWDNTASAFC